MRRLAVRYFEIGKIQNYLTESRTYDMLHTTKKSVRSSMVRTIFLSIFNVDCCQTSSSVPFSFECGNNALVSILGQPQEQKTKCEKTWFYFLKVLFFYAKYRKYYPIPRSPGILISTSRYEIMIKSSDSEYAIPLTQSRRADRVELPHFMQRNF